MTDSVRTIGQSLLQHGPDNDRAYLFELCAEDLPQVLAVLDEFRETRRYGKLIAKIPRALADALLERGFECEAAVAGLFRDPVATEPVATEPVATDPDADPTGLFLVFYVDPLRRPSPQLRGRVESVLGATFAKAQDKQTAFGSVVLRALDESHLPALAALYREVFASYPFPIFDVEFLRQSMNTNVSYFGAFDDLGLCAASSAERHNGERNVEMTDFATLPRARGQSYSLHLLHLMELAMRSRGVATAYTIARALVPGMNITFARAGYHFDGTLWNNTNIGGQLEPMNVWSRPLL